MNRTRDLVATVRFHIRPCREADLEALEWMGVFSPHRDTLHRVWSDHQEGRAVMLVAEADEFPVGQAWVDLPSALDTPRHEQHGEIWALRVLPGLRGAGIGRALLRAGERTIRRAGRGLAQLAVAIDNPRAESLYQRLGYRVIGDKVAEIGHRAHDGSYVVQHEHQHVLEKRLARRARVTPDRP